jgi:hypothetical protein
VKRCDNRRLYGALGYLPPASTRRPGTLKPSPPWLGPGVDSPETIAPDRPAGCLASEASFRNKAIVEGKTVHLEKDVSQTDPFIRRTATVEPNTQARSLLSNPQELLGECSAQALGWERLKFGLAD